MREILTWGNVEKEFKRLNIQPKCTWKGYGWDKQEKMAVCNLTEEEFKALLEDVKIYSFKHDSYVVGAYEKLSKFKKEQVSQYPEEAWIDTGWRYSKGCILGSTDYPLVVNGQKMNGFEPHNLEDYEEMLKEEQERIKDETGKDVDIGDIDLPVNEYSHLLQYLCDEVRVSTETNVTACCVSLARGNNLTLGQLFEKYQTRKKGKFS